MATDHRHAELQLWRCIELIANEPVSTAYKQAVGPVVFKAGRDFCFEFI